MSLLLKMVDDVSVKVLAPLKRFPFASLSSFIFTLLMIIKMVYEGEELEIQEIVDKIIFVSLLAFFFFISLQLFKKGWISSIVGLILVVGYYFYLPPIIGAYIDGAEGKIISTLMFILFFFFIIVSPFLDHKSSNRAFFEWFKHIVYILFLSVMFALLLFTILNVGWDIVRELFNLKRYYWYVSLMGLFSFSFVGVFFFLSQIVKEPTQIEIKEYTSIAHFFVKYILTALFILYFIIIYAYTGKMIVLSEYPNGVISLNIIAFSIVAILTYIFWTPFWNEKNEKYKKVIWIAILLQTLLLAVALYLRVEPYGWTFGRVIIASLGLWLFILSLYALVKKKISYQVMFISIPLLLIFNLLFASNISKISQQNRLGELLANYGSLSNDSNLSVGYNISSKIDYLYTHYGTDALFPLIPTIVTEYENRNSMSKKDCSAIGMEENFSIYATEKLGFKYVTQWDWIEFKNNRSSLENKRRFKYYYTDVSYEYGLEVKGYDTFMEFRFYKEYNDFETSELCPSSLSDNLSKKSNLLVTTKPQTLSVKYKNEKVVEINLSRFFGKILNKKRFNKEKNGASYTQDNFSQDEFTYRYKNNTVRIKLIFKSVRLSIKNEVVSYDGVLLFQHN